MNNEKLKKCIDYIKSDHIKKSALVITSLLPDYFYEIPASSTGKYHPNYSLGEGGLLRHTKAAMKIANTLLYENSSTSFSVVEKDLILFSILIHDGLKLGINREKYTRFDHPALIADFVKQNAGLLFLSEDEINIVVSAVSSHMGEWNVSYDGRETLPKPVTEIDKFVHMCDYLASRKFLEVELSDL